MIFDQIVFLKKKVFSDIDTLLIDDTYFLPLLT